MKKGSLEHEAEVDRLVADLKSKGHKAINLHGKSPDGIAIIDGKLVALEVLKKVKYERKNYDPKQHHGRFVQKFEGGTMRQKRDNYDMFDDVVFGFYQKHQKFA